MITTSAITNRTLYRLPWSLADNPTSWLEPTSMCNLSCDGCYRANERQSHKSLDQIAHELDVFQDHRNADAIALAGGEQLLHPQIVEIVRMIREREIKPNMLTNGLLLTEDLLRRLKAAGLYGIQFHVDSRQGRGGPWRGKNELELNELRASYARMVAGVGGIACAFNSTVYEDTLQYLPGMVAWAHRNIDIVHTLVFIAFRHVVPKMPFDWYAGAQKIDWQTIPYHSDDRRRIDISSRDMMESIRSQHPDFTPAAFLNGTEDVHSFKWLLAVRVGTRQRLYGYAGPRFMELFMAYHHFAKGTYPSFEAPRSLTRGRAAMLLLWPFDAGLKRAAARFLRNPLNLARRAHLQTIAFIQPVDFLEDGRQSMCDGCPDMTVFGDELVWSCRLEERKMFGTTLRTYRREA